MAQKHKEKYTMKLLQRKQLQDSRKIKSKLKVKDGLPPKSAFLLSLLARHDNFNDALIRIRVVTQKRAS